MAQITYTDKVALNENPEIAAINKVSDDDMNEIKSVVNANYNQTIQITDTQPSDNNWKLWIDNSEVADNTYYNDNGTATQFKATTYDTLPIGTEVDYDGNTVPTGWTEIAETNCYKKLLATPVSADSSGIITQSIEDYTNYDFLIVEYSVYQDKGNQTMMIPTFTIDNSKNFYPTYFQSTSVYESIIMSFPTTTQIKFQIDTIAGWTKTQFKLFSITGIKMNMIN